MSQSLSARDRWVFDTCPRSLWIQDFSDVIAAFDELRADGVTDLDAFFEDSPGVLYEMLGLVRVLDVNRATLQLYGARDVSHLQGEIGAIFTDETLPVFRRELVTLFHGWTTFTGQAITRRLDGRRVDIELELAVTGDPPDYGRVLVTINDVTERTAALAAVHAAERRYQDLFQRAPDVFISVDAVDRTVREVNDTYVEVTGIPRDEAVGWSFLSLYHPQAADEVRLAFDRLLREGDLRGVELIARRADGSALPVEVSAIPVRDTRGQLTHFRSTWRDVSALRQAREAQRRAEMDAHIAQAQKLESLGVLAGGIAHDFNNLLVGIMGNVGLAQMALSPGDPARFSLERAQETGERAADLCRQMLAYSGRGRFVVRPVDISELVQEMAQLLAVSISKDVRLQFRLTPGLPLVQADASQLRQVVMNLVTNGAESIGRDGGVVTVRTIFMHCDEERVSALEDGAGLAPGPCVVLSVSDTGCGMEASTRARMLEPFFSTRFTGRGLGLAAVIGIVRGHRGALDVETAPGRGSAFRVYLPATANEAAPAPEIERRAGPVQVSGKVLVVDDEETVRQVARETLAAIGLDVIEADNGEVALEIYDAHQSELVLVLLDLTMPRLDGEETFRAFRRIRSDIPVLLSSGYNEQDVVTRFTGQGLAGFLQKPWTPRSLTRKVLSILSADRPDRDPSSIG